MLRHGLSERRAMPVVRTTADAVAATTTLTGWSDADSAAFLKRKEPDDFASGCGLGTRCETIVSLTLRGCPCYKAPRL